MRTAQVRGNTGKYMNIWLKTAAGLGALWAIALGGIYWLHASRPTAQSVTAYLAHAGLAARSPAERTGIISRAEDQLNALGFEERQQLRREGATREFFLSLTPSEQIAFLDATLPADFKQMMEAFNKMEPAKRKEFVARAIGEMKKHEADAPPPRGELEEKIAQRVTDQGLKAFYSEADADTKLDLAPLIEQMQRNLQFGGGG